MNSESFSRNNKDGCHRSSVNVLVRVNVQTMAHNLSTSVNYSKEMIMLVAAVI